jgi:pilus assembly protein CpaE
MSVIKFPQVTVIGARGREVESHLIASGIRVTSLPATELTALSQPTARAPQVVMVDLRDSGTLPAAVGVLRRHHQATAVVLLVDVLEPALMLEAMRAGVTEIVPAPLTQASLEAAIGRVWQAGAANDEPAGQVFAVIGAKGGVGTTTVAVNLASVLAREAPGDVLVIDFHVAQGDAAVLLGVEPRYSVVDALENTHRLDEAYFRGLVVTAPKGPDVLASSDRHVVGTPGADRVRALVDFASRHYRHVVLDLPRTDLTILDGLDAVQRILLIVNQELSAVRSAARLVESLGQRYTKERLALVLIRFDKGAEIDTADIEKAVGVAVRYVIPNDYKASVRAANQGVPLAIGDATNKVATAVKDLAADVAGLRKPEPAPTTGGLLGRLALRRTQAY